MKRSSKGFTLLEVMVALSIFAVLSIALYGAGRYLAANAAGLTERSLMYWIADNRLTELRAGMRPLVDGNDQETIEFGGRTWQLTTAVSAAPNKQLRVIELTVSSAPDAPSREIKLLGYIGADR